jgi:hypothetical protein
MRSVPGDRFTDDAGPPVLRFRSRRFSSDDDEGYGE